MTRPLPRVIAALASALLAVSSARAQEDAPPPPADAPRQVIVRKDPAHRPSLWRGLTQGAGRALRRLWEKEQPEAAQGNEKAAQGDVKGALEAYDEAQKRLSDKGDPAAALAFNRSGALLKGEATEAPKALEQALRAQESSDPALRAKAAYNAALALEQAGKTDEALQGYAQALRLDSDDADSKVNLELLLRQKERQKKQPQQGAQDKDQKQQKEEQQQQQAKGDKDKDEQQKSGEQQDKDKQEQKEKEQQQQEAQDQKGQEQQQEQAQQEKKDPPEQAQQIGRTEAQRLLDAAKAGEKNLQAWRFGKKPEKDRRRSAAEKDW